MKNVNPATITSSNTGTKMGQIHHLVAMKLLKLGVGSAMNRSVNAGRGIQVVRVVMRSMMRAVSNVTRIGSRHLECGMNSGTFLSDSIVCDD
jgi:xanthine/uracil permease